MKDLTTYLRELAKSNKYQTLYANEKPIGLKLFVNDYDYSNLQIMFLNYLSMYYAINFDISMGEVDDRVLEDFIYEDAYLTYKNKERKKDMKENVAKKKEIKYTKDKPEKLVKTQFIFRKPKGSI